MRILFCNYEYPPLGGGGGVVMAAIARELARRHDVTVLTSRAAGLDRESSDGSARIVRVPVLFRTQRAVANLPSMAAYLPMGAWRGLQLARQRPFDLINTHFVVPSGPLGSFLSRRLGVPNVLSVHGGDLYDPSKSSSPHRHALLRRAVSSLLRRADTVVAQSGDTAAKVRDLYGVTRPVELVPLGIERPPAVPNACRAELGLPEDAFVLITVGRLVPRKAGTQLVQVLAGMLDPARHGPSARAAADRRDSAARRAGAGARSSASAQTGPFLLVVGDGPDLPVMRRLAAERGLADRVRFLGQATEAQKQRALSLADAFVSTSQHEGFGLVFLEAMAFGLPIVCYDRGGQTDFLSTPDTGYVVALNDLDAFTLAVQELERSPARRQSIRGHNLLAVERFFVDRCALAYESLFESALGERSKRCAALRAS